MDIVEFIEARLAEREMWAREASRRDEGPVVEGGVHWQWETHNDEVIALDPGTMIFVDDEQSYASLRSVEEFETHSVGMLPQFAIHSATEVPVCVGGHIVRHDPAWVLADVAAKRRILDRHRQCGDGVGWCGDGGHDWGIAWGRCLELRELSEIDAGHPDFDQRWMKEQP